MNPAGLILAELDRREVWQALRQGLGRPQQAEDYYLWLMLFGGVMVCTLVVLVLHRLRRRPSKKAVRRNFLHSAINVLRLNPAEARDVQTLAARSEHPNPAAMLLSPANLGAALALAAQRRDDPELRGRIEALGRKLFTSPISSA